MKLVFATNNAHKVLEVNEVLRGGALEGIEVVTMRDIGCTDDLPETTGTIVGNSAQKAEYLYEKFGVDCFSEDTGLEIAALGGEPGVDTAHYAGTRDADANIALVLSKLAGIENRKAQFRTVITLIYKGEMHVFEGICEGYIRTEKAEGTEGFGYDPIFEVAGIGRTFNQMSAAEKAAISHRGKATEKLLRFLSRGF